MKLKTAEMLTLGLLTYITAVAWLTPTLVVAEYYARGTFAIGGEWCGLLTIPFALLGIVSVYCHYLNDEGDRKHEKHTSRF